MSFLTIIGLFALAFVAFCLGCATGYHGGWSSGYNAGWQDGHKDGLMQKNLNNDQCRKYRNYR